MVFFLQKFCKKSQFEEEKEVVSLRMVHQYNQEVFLFLVEKCFTEETRVCVSSDGIVRVYRRNGTFKKILSPDERSLMFRVAIQSD